MKKHETHYRKRWQNMAEGSANFSPIRVNAHKEKSKDNAYECSPKSRQERFPIHRMEPNEKSMSLNVDRVSSQLKESRLLNHSTRNSAFRPVSPKQKG